LKGKKPHVGNVTSRDLRIPAELRQHDLSGKKTLKGDIRLQGKGGQGP